MMWDFMKRFPVAQGQPVAKVWWDDCLLQIRAICYAERYADVKAAYGYDIGRLLEHYRTNGMRERRILDCNTTLQNVNGVMQDEAHQILCYAQRYYSLYDKLGCDPIGLKQHYELHGRDAGRVWGCDAVNHTTPPPSSPTLPNAPPPSPPAPACPGNARPFLTAHAAVCVPEHFYPSPDVAACALKASITGWRDLRQQWHQWGVVTGGLGKLLVEDEWEVWVCGNRGLCEGGDEMLGGGAVDTDAVCFVYSERHRLFVPWGLRSKLRI